MLGGLSELFFSSRLSSLSLSSATSNPPVRFEVSALVVVCKGDGR